MRLFPSPRSGNAVIHFVAKLVKSFGRVGVTAESLDDFRFTLCRFREKNLTGPSFVAQAQAGKPAASSACFARLLFIVGLRRIIFLVALDLFLNF